MTGHAVRNISILGAGGTIASTRSGESASRATLGPDDLLPTGDPLIGAQITRVQEFARINSWTMTQEQMRELAVAARTLAADPSCDGVVVTHGTDTIDKSAFLADLLYPGTTPIVFVGAMLPADHPRADGPVNLRHAIEAIASGVLDGAGVTVCVGADVHAARTVQKHHTVSLDAFSSGDAGPIACRGVTDTWERTGGRINRVHIDIPTGRQLSPVPVVSAQHLPVPGALAATLAATQAHACVIEGLGAGNVPQALADEIMVALDGGVFVALATRVPRGGVAPIYRGPGGGFELLAAGVHSAKTLTAAQAALLAGALDGAGRLRTDFDACVTALTEEFTAV